ncbi:MAG: acyl-CoA thioesterase II [Spongiibacteraceae bacterium]
MSKVLDEVIAANRLERLDDNLFRGYGNWGPAARLYGGQVMSQAMSAAQQTVTGNFVLHSMHCYFMRPGDPRRAVIYDVELIRDGKSFLTRRVTARQYGHAIFSCQLSYQKPEQGFDHQLPMPQVEPPDGLRSEADVLAAELLRGAPAGLEKQVPTEWPIDFRPVNPVDHRNPKPQPPVSHVWMRALAPLPDDLALHQQLLGFASDHTILVTALRPHGVTFMLPGLQFATIDHAIWFHRPFRMDEWLLYVTESPSASNARGFSTGRIYQRDGALVASVTQEGLLRQHSQPKT